MTIPRLRSWYYEIPALYLLLLVIQRSFLPDLPAFYKVSPHPYWIGVLVFGLRYGLASGLTSGVAAAALYLGGIWYGGDRFLFEDADFYLLPGFFIAGGALFGGVVDRLRDRCRASAERSDDFKERNRKLREELDIQRQAARAIEQQVVSQMSSLVTLYQGARDLSTLDRKALLEGILDFFTASLKAEKASIHLLEGERWKLHIQRGWRDEDRYPDSLDHAQGVIGRAGSENKVVSLRDWFGTDVSEFWEGENKADAVMAGPLRRDTGEVIGVYSVQEMPLLSFSSASVNLMTLLIDWAETSISKCIYFEELKSKLILDEVCNVYNEKYFKSRTQQEFSRSKTYALPFSVLLVSVPGLRALTRDKHVNALRAMGRLLQETCRDIDIVTKSGDPDIPFAVLMMTATRENAAELRGKIIEAYGKLDFLAQEGSGGEPLRIGIGSYGPKMTSVEDLVAQARKDIGS